MARPISADPYEAFPLLQADQTFKIKDGRVEVARKGVGTRVWEAIKRVFGFETVLSKKAFSQALNVLLNDPEGSAAHKIRLLQRLDANAYLKAQLVGELAYEKLVHKAAAVDWSPDEVGVEEYREALASFADFILAGDAPVDVVHFDTITLEKFPVDPELILVYRRDSKTLYAVNKRVREELSQDEYIINSDSIEKLLWAAVAGEGSAEGAKKILAHLYARRALEALLGEDDEAYQRSFDKMKRCVGTQEAQNLLGKIVRIRKDALEPTLQDFVERDRVLVYMKATRTLEVFDKKSINVNSPVLVSKPSILAKLLQLTLFHPALSADGRRDIERSIEKLVPAVAAPAVAPESESLPQWERMAGVLKLAREHKGIGHNFARAGNVTPIPWWHVSTNAAGVSESTEKLVQVGMPKAMREVLLGRATVHRVKDATEALKLLGVAKVYQSPYLAAVACWNLCPLICGQDLDSDTRDTLITHLQHAGFLVTEKILNALREPNRDHLITSAVIDALEGLKAFSYVEETTDFPCQDLWVESRIRKGAESGQLEPLDTLLQSRGRFHGLLHRKGQISRFRAIQVAIEGAACGGHEMTVKELLREEGPYWKQIPKAQRGKSIEAAIKGAARGGQSALLRELCDEGGPYWKHISPDDHPSLLRAAVKIAAEHGQEVVIRELLDGDEFHARVQGEDQAFLILASIEAAARGGKKALFAELLRVNGPYWLSLTKEGQARALFGLFRGAAEGDQKEILRDLIDVNNEYWLRLPQAHREKALREVVFGLARGGQPLLRELLRKEGSFWQLIVAESDPDLAVEDAIGGLAESGQSGMLRELLDEHGPFWLDLTPQQRTNVLMRMFRGAAFGGHEALIKELLREEGPYWQRLTESQRKEAFEEVILSLAEAGHSKLFFSLKASKESFWEHMDKPAALFLRAVWIAAFNGDRAFVRELFSKDSKYHRTFGKLDAMRCAAEAAARGGHKALLREILDQPDMKEQEYQLNARAICGAVRGGHWSLFQELIYKDGVLRPDISNDQIFEYIVANAVAGGHEAFLEQFLNPTGPYARHFPEQDPRKVAMWKIQGAAAGNREAVLAELLNLHWRQLDAWEKETMIRDAVCEAARNGHRDLVMEFLQRRGRYYGFVIHRRETRESAFWAAAQSGFGRRFADEIGQTY